LTFLAAVAADPQVRISTGALAASGPATHCVAGSRFLQFLGAHLRQW
jgi:hypothetical protein